MAPVRMMAAARQDAAQAPKPDAQTERACRDMEALFLKQLLSEMRRAGGSMMKGGPGADIYQELFDQELSQQLARSTDLGVARMLRRELARSAGPREREAPAEPGRQDAGAPTIQGREAPAEPGWRGAGAPTIREREAPAEPGRQNAGAPGVPAGSAVLKRGAGSSEP